MKILIACEFTDTVGREFRALGHDVTSCDLLPSEGQGKHYQGDVMDILHDGWNMVIAHPPCTYLANVGVQHLHKDPGRWGKMQEAVKFFRIFYNLRHVPMVCIENPVPHRYAQLPDYNQIVNPFDFGDSYSKRTCLWLKGLPPLMSTRIVDKGERYFRKNGKSNGSKWYQLDARSQKDRSRTFPGMAKAMSMQWTCRS